MKVESDSVERRVMAGGHVEVRHRTAQDETYHVVTFDHYHDEHTFDREAFGEHFFAVHGIGATHVLTRDNDWFQYRDIDAVLAAVRSTIPHGASILAYGSSMGGYAAIRFADSVGAHRVLALSPQYSIDPTIMPEEIRWRADQSRIRFLARLNGPVMCAAETTIIYDPCGVNGVHVDRLARDITLNRIGIRHAGHPSGTLLAELGLISAVTTGALKGTLDDGAILRQSRAARSRSTVYVCNLAMAQPASRPKLALALAEHAVRLQPASPIGHHFLA